MVKKKTTRTQLVKKCDALFSKLVRAEGACAKCGTPHNLQCAHGFSRRYRNVRWDFTNAWPLCRGCHVFYTHRPIEWDLWMLDQLGVTEYARLRFRAIDATNKVDVESVYEDLRARFALEESA